MVEHWEAEVDEALRALGADLPEMDARAFTAGRARLLATMGTPPMAGAAMTELDAVVLALPPDGHRRSPPLRKAAPWLAVAAAVAAVAVGAVVLLPGDDGTPNGSTPPGATPTTSPTTVEPSAVPGRMPPAVGRPGEPLPAMPAQPLNPAGDLAAHAADIPVPPGKVLYVRSQRTQAKDSTGPGGTETDELWVPADREGVWMSRRRATGNIQGRSEKDFEEQRAPAGRFDGIDPQSPWALTPKNVAQLPRDPAALYEKIRAEVNAPLPAHTGTSMTAAQQAVHRVVSLLGDTTGGVPADLRAALLRTLGYLPGVTATPGATASDGRAAVALAWTVDDGDYRNELLVDPATARVVEWRNVAVKAFQGHPAGQTLTSDLRTEAVVAAMGERP